MTAARTLPPPNPVTSLINKPVVIALVSGLLGYAGSLYQSSIALTVRVQSLEEWSAEHKRNSVSREEFNRLDRAVQQRASRDEVRGLEKRLDDIRGDLAYIKQVLARR